MKYLLNLVFFQNRSDLERLQFDFGLIAPILNFKAEYSLHQYFRAVKLNVKAIGDISGIFSEALPFERTT